MIIPFLRRLALSLMLALPVSSAIAEDIDLFTGVTAPTDIPNVLFILDNTANWNQPFTAEINALSKAFASLPSNKFRVSLMLFSETGGGNSNVDGAYVRAAMRTLDDGTKGKYATLVRSLDKLADKSNGGKAGKTMVEAYRYLSGGAPMAGNLKVKTDYAGNLSGTAASQAIYALPGNALNAKDGSPYVSPSAVGCAGTYIIYISNGAAQDNSADSTTATTALRDAGGDATQVAVSPSGSQDNMADEWARYLNTRMGVKVYTIEAAQATGGQGPGWSALLKSMAGLGGGDYYDVSASADLEKALGGAINEITSKIQAVNSVFASASLPISVNTQGTYLNQVFIGMFRPDENGRPRWNGNLKQYKLGIDTATQQLILQDARDTNAINNLTGFIAPCARSYWTSATADTYWGFDPSGECTTEGARASDSPDGNVVEKGGQAHMLRAILPAKRKVLTCTGAVCTTFSAFDTNTTAAPAAFGLVAGDTAGRNTLIDWSRGINKSTDLTTYGATETAMRPSIHGDVVHSRPVAVNYGTDAQPQVVVFYGANDGMLRAVNGNRTAAIGGAAAGSELWSFMPMEFYASIKRLYDNNPLIAFKNGGTLSGVTTTPKSYGMDGPVAAYRQGNRAWLFASMRRGGRALYAFDVSDPANPSPLWRKGCVNATDDVGCDTGMAGIGQTWSSPKTLNASAYGNGASPLLVFGGGYDRCEDEEQTPNPCNLSTKGNRIFVLDAATGTLVREFTTARAVIGEVTVMNDSAGLAKVAYVADLGGNVYRIDIGTRTPATWNLSKIASLGCDTVGTTPTCNDNRKFMFGPDVVEDNGMYVLLLGSGDREKPLRAWSRAFAVSNRFYMLVDKPSDPTWLNPPADQPTQCGGQSLLCHDSLLAIARDAPTPAPSDLAAKKGWYLELAAGEQVVTASVTAYGVTTFNTHIPTDGATTQSCKSNLGTANVYNVAYANAAAQGGLRFADVVGGGLAPSPVVGRVQLDDGSLRDVVIGGSPESFLSPKGMAAKAAFRQPKGRVYWFIQK